MAKLPAPFWGLMIGLGSGFLATVFAATVVNRWFSERRGVVMGVLAASSAMGQLVFLPLLGWIFVEHQLGAGFAAFGSGAVRTVLGNYTSAFLAAGLMCALAATAVLFIAREFRQINRT